MSKSILNPDRIGVQPFSNHGCVHVIVVAPIFVSGVVRRVNENAVDLTRIMWKKGFQGVKVVTMNDEIAIKGGLADTLFCMCDEWTKWNCQMMVVYELLAFET
ncbi:MAG: hypothetical protein OXD44_05860, partial [Gammaproteobacteria bacterium]|nr:hypothetical protein [Gammaproteobacteria bacterium]